SRYQQRSRAMPSKPEQPFDELAGLQDILNELRKRRYYLMLNEARQGHSTPPEILMEIETLDGRIDNLVTEITRVSTEMAQDRFSLAEAEYRESLARVWGSPDGHLTFADDTKLELQRLRLGIPPKRAAELAHNVHEKLAEEVFYNIVIELI